MTADEFVKNVKKILDERGISYTRAGRESGCGEEFVRSMERQKSAPSFVRVQKMAQYLGMTTSELLGEEVKPALGSKEERYPAYSQEACRLAEDYDKKLDAWGKRQVRAVADNEIARCEDELRFLEETAEPKEAKIIPLYRNPAAAGYASPVFGQDYDPYSLEPDDPQGAVFAVRLQGDSMEPDFPDGSIVFCSRDPLADGDIGVFNVNGASVCKQYHKEGPMTFLFSLNRKRSDADVMLLPGGNHTLVCQGRVITRKRYKVPGR